MPAFRHPTIILFFPPIYSHCWQPGDYCLPSGIQPYSFLRCIISQLILESLLASQRIISYLQASSHIFIFFIAVLASWFCIHCLQPEDHFLSSGIPLYSFRHCIVNQLIYFHCWQPEDHCQASSNILFFTGLSAITFCRIISYLHASSHILILHCRISQMILYLLLATRGSLPSFRHPAIFFSSLQY